VQLQRTDLQASGLLSWWRVFSDTYEELVQSVASPTRAEYALEELGERQVRLQVKTLADDGGETTSDCEVARRDFQLRNARGEALECSFWPLSSARAALEPPPCVVYLHGMSSSRKECMYLRDRVLRAGFSLFTLDFSGAGKSGGDRVSFGYFEHDDVRAVVDYLYATRTASRVALWGRDIGAVAAMLHVRDRLEYCYETWQVAPRELKSLLIVEDKAKTVASARDSTAESAAGSSDSNSRATAHQLLCIRQPSKGSLSFRWSRYSAHNGDFVLLAVDGELVEGKDPMECADLMRRRVAEKHRAMNGDTPTPCIRDTSLRLTGYRRKNASGMFASALEHSSGSQKLTLGHFLRRLVCCCCCCISTQESIQELPRTTRSYSPWLPTVLTEIWSK
jgi:pimeloyl-ACP methyl ester carboxylesterase